MDKSQYDFSNMFWEDDNFNIDDGIPKYYTMNEGDMKFYYLTNTEVKDFMKIKSLENPEVMKDIRYKKLSRILKTNK